MKGNILGILVDIVDYGQAVERITAAAAAGQGYSVTALAVHGIMTGVGDSHHKYRLNQFDLVTPDGQPVRWALNWLHRANLKDRVYGPRLMLEVCEAAARQGLPVYLYGSRSEVLTPLSRNLQTRFPGLRIAGVEPSKFRTTSLQEKEEIVARIRDSGARITFVGLGCPRQEVFAYEYRDDLCMPVIAVGAAFDYHAGLLAEPPEFMQRHGLQWLYRLLQEPRRLWRRYLVLNLSYLTLFGLQALRLWKPEPEKAQRPDNYKLFG